MAGQYGQKKEKEDMEREFEKAKRMTVVSFAAGLLGMLAAVLLLAVPEEKGCAWGWALQMAWTKGLAFLLAWASYRLWRREA